MNTFQSPALKQAPPRPGALQPVWVNHNGQMVQGFQRPQQQPQQQPMSGLQQMFAQPQQQQSYSPTINTSITPQEIYTPKMTAGAVSTAKALQDQQADPRYQMKQFAGPGRSMDAGTMYAAMPNIAAAKSAGSLAQAAIPLEDLIANQKHLLSGEMAREDEAMGWGNLLARQYDNQMGRQTQNTSNILSVLSNLLLSPYETTDYSQLLGAL